MRQLKDLWEQFNNKYFNHPVEFEDIISSDGVKNTYVLSYWPLCDHEPYKPQVIDISSGDPVELNEGGDYVIDYEKGVLRFMNIPQEKQESVIVRGFYQKCNLREFCLNYNVAINLLQSTFPVKVLDRIDWQENLTEKEEDLLENFKLTQEPFDKYSRIFEIYQEETDKQKIPFRIRHDLITFTGDHLSLPRRSGPSDYGRRIQTMEVGVRFPFYVYAELKYQEVDFNEEPLLQPVQFEYNAINQVLILLGRMMYDNWLHKSISMAQTVLNMQDQMTISKQVQSLDMQLWGDLQNNYKASSVPSNKKSIYG